MRCDEARRRLLAHAWDHGASRHLESCAACFEALEAADRLADAVRRARPEEVPAPAGLADAVLSRRRGRRAGLVPAAAFAVLLLAGSGALELLAGAWPTWLGALAGDLAAGAAGALAPLVAVRDILLGRPAALMALAAVTLAVCALWTRHALLPQAWRTAR